jgi:hypothetical protein
MSLNLLVVGILEKAMQERQAKKGSAPDAEQ